MGLLGTDIASSFAERIFEIYSSDGIKIKLEEYLNYIDIYHHGNERERCVVTFKLMDLSRNGFIDKAEFENYISLIIGAIKKVHPGAEENLLSSEEIDLLFKKIAENKEYFTYMQFEDVYFNKPHLLSWIDYFKNNDHEVLSFININIKTLFVLFDRFYGNIGKIFDQILKMNGNTFNFESVIKEIEKFHKVMESKKKEFLDAESAFNIRSIFDDLTQTNANNFDQNYNSNDLQDHNFSKRFYKFKF